MDDEISETGCVGRQRGQPFWRSKGAGVVPEGWLPASEIRNV